MHSEAVLLFQRRKEYSDNNFITFCPISGHVFYMRQNIKNRNFNLDSLLYIWPPIKGTGTGLSFRRSCEMIINRV